MNTRISLIILLCLLLPLQTLAGTLVGCKYLDDATSYHSTSTAMTHHCGNKAPTLSADHAKYEQCNHCQILCLSHILALISPVGIHLNNYKNSFPSSISILISSVFLDLPHRPPQLTA